MSSEETRGHVWHRVRHRVTQFVETAVAPLQPIDEAYVRARLGDQPEPAKLWALFRQMPRAEQAHGIRVCRTLERQGFDDGDLLAAALLHDVGKSMAPPRIWERVLVVLAERFTPDVASSGSEGRAPSDESRGLLQAMTVRRCHPEWGADLAAEAGATARTVALIRQHHCEMSTSETDAELAALQAADES